MKQRPRDNGPGLRRIMEQLDKYMHNTPQNTNSPKALTMAVMLCTRQKMHTSAAMLCHGLKMLTMAAMLCSRLKALTMVAILCLGVILSLAIPANAQEVARPGTFSITELSVTDDIEGYPIVPPLEDHQGVVRVVVERNNFFSIEDVARWMRNNHMQFIRLGADVSNARVREDDAVWIRFQQDFIGESQTIERSVQIRHPAGHFDNFFRRIQFYRQQIVTYRVGVENEPVFTEEFVPTGSLAITANVESANISIFNERGERVDERLAVSPHPEEEGYLVMFDNIPAGTYTLQATAGGMRTVNLSGISVVRNEVTRRSVELVRDEAVDQSMARLIITTNIQEVDMDLLYEDGSRETRTIFDGLLRANLEPGRYRFTIEPEGFQRFEKTMELEAGEVYEENMLFTLQQPIRRLRIRSDPHDARVFVNNRHVGTTPVLLRDVEREPLEIILSHDYHRTHVDTLMLHTEEEYAYLQEMEEAYIELNTLPESVVYQDGERLGVTPRLIGDPEPREYHFRFERQHFAELDTVVDMREQDVFQMEEPLIRPRAEVTLNPVNPAIPIDIDIVNPRLTYQRENQSRPELDIPYGNYDLRFERNGFHTLEKTVSIDQEVQVINYELMPKSKTGAFIRSMFLPGAGQYYWGNNFRGSLFLFGFLGVAGYTAHEIYQYIELEDEYEQAILNYRNETHLGSLERHHEIMDGYHVRLLDRRGDLDQYIRIAAGIYALNLLDRLITRSAGRIYRREAGTGSAGVSLTTSPGSLGVSLDF